MILYRETLYGKDNDSLITNYITDAAKQYFIFFIRHNETM